MTVTVLVPDERAAEIISAVDGVTTVTYPALDDLPPEAAKAKVLVPDIMTTVPDGLADRMPALELVQTLTAGAEAWIGKLPPSVMVSTARGAHGGSSAEWAMMALLAVYRDLFTFEDRRRAGTWTRHRADTLQDKNVLVIGAGDLGQNMRRRLLAFDAHPTLIASHPRDGIHPIDTIHTLLPTADAVVLMVPLTTATRGMVNAKFLSALPDGAVVVNVARGPVVDTDALLAELVSGRLRAALDVTDPEPLPPGHPLWTAPNLLLTPHIAGQVAGHRDRAYRIAATEIATYLTGAPPANTVTGDY